MDVVFNADFDFKTNFYKKRRHSLSNENIWCRIDRLNYACTYCFVQQPA